MFTRCRCFAYRVSVVFTVVISIRTESKSLTGLDPTNVKFLAIKFNSLPHLPDIRRIMLDQYSLLQRHHSWPRHTMSTSFRPSKFFREVISILDLVSADDKKSIDPVRSDPDAHGILAGDKARTPVARLRHYGSVSSRLSLFDFGEDLCSNVVRYRR